MFGKIAETTVWGLAESGMAEILVPTMVRLSCELVVVANVRVEVKLVDKTINANIPTILKGTRLLIEKGTIIKKEAIAIVPMMMSGRMLS